MSKSIVEDLDLGFVKQSPWVLRDRELRKAAAAKAEAELQKAVHETKESTVAELEYGLGYVKRIRDRFLALSRQSEALVLSSALPKRRDVRNVAEPVGHGSKIDKNGHPVVTKEATAAIPDLKSADKDPTPSKDPEERPSETPKMLKSTIEDQQNHGPLVDIIDTSKITKPLLTQQPSSMLATMLEEVEKIGRELYRTAKNRLSITVPGDADEVPEIKSVRSIRQLFELGPVPKSKTTSDHYIACEAKRDHGDPTFDIPYLTLELDHNGLEEGFPVFEFPVAEGLSYPPPTPYPLDAEITFLDFESSLHPATSEQLENTGESTGYCDSLNTEATIRPAPSLDETTIITSPDVWMKRSRRLPAPTRRGETEMEADCSAFAEMQFMLSQFQRRRSGNRELGDSLVQNPEPAVDILPNDPSPSIIPQDGSSPDEHFHSDDSFDTLSLSEDDLEAEVLEWITQRSNSVDHVKKRRIHFEIIGGGLIPGKTNLAQGPKSLRKELEFSELPPKAYAYLEESFASTADEWVPGQELSIEQYREIKDEEKVERYKKIIASTPYYPPYEESEPDGMLTPLTYGGFYPPMTADEVCLIELRTPMPPSHHRLLAPVSSFNPEWYIRPPPAYPIAIHQQSARTTL